MDLVIWMVILLGINWGGFALLLARTMRSETSRTKRRPDAS